MDNAINWGEIPQPDQTPTNQVQWDDIQENNPLPKNEVQWGDTSLDSKPQTEPQSQSAETFNWEELSDGSSSDDFHSWEDDSDTNQEETSIQEGTPTQDFNQYDESSIPRTYSKLGSVNKIQINTDLYTLNFDVNQLIDEIQNLTPTPLDEKGRYGIDFSQGEQLNKVILALKQVASLYNSSLRNCFIYKIDQGDKLLNIFKGKPSNSFIYYLQADHNSSHVINDLSSIGGPSISQTDPSVGILNVFPGWVPYSLSENNSEGEMIAIAGTFE